MLDLNLLGHVAPRGAANISLARVTRDLQRAVATHKDAGTDAFENGLLIGELAIEVKGLVPKGQFVLWLERNIPQVTRQWVRQCMRAVEARDLYRKRPDARNFEGIASIEVLAGLKSKLEGGAVDFVVKMRSHNWQTNADLRARIVRLEHLLDLHHICHD